MSRLVSTGLVSFSLVGGIGVGAIGVGAPVARGANNASQVVSYDHGGSASDGFQNASHR
jgi:hypothetical protein